MKKITLIICLITGSLNAQIVNIPDFNFKDTLVNNFCVDTDLDGVFDSDADTNNDGEIQLSEAQSVVSLNLSSEDIMDMTGIESFVNLEVLDCSNNFFNAIDLTTLNALRILDISGNLLVELDIDFNLNLEELDCSFNAITALNINLNLDLERLNCASNNITSIDVSTHPSLTALVCDNMFSLNTLNVSQCPNLNTVNCEFSSISNLNASSNPNLEFLYCFSNNINALNINQTPALKVLHCYDNNISNLDVTTSPLLEDLEPRFNNIFTLDVSQNLQLQRLILNSNDLSSIDVTQNLQLQYFSLSNNSLISNIDLSQNINLLDFSCSNTQLTSLDVTQNVILQDLRIPFNQLTSLDLTQNPQLEYLYANNNQLTTLDLTENPNFLQIRLDDNDLISLFLKNGNQETSNLTFEGNDDIEYICADEVDMFIVDLRLSDYGYSNTVLNTYCSFEPGGNFYTITGNIIYDLNNDGCDATDTPQPHIRIDIEDVNTIQESTYTGSDGTYFFYTFDGDFDLTPNLEQPTWFNLTPPVANIILVDGTPEIVNQDFCISANGVHNDLEIAVAPITPSRPGFDAVYQIVYNNKGNQTLSGNFEFNYDASVLDFVSATITPETQNSGSLTWNYTDLLPFENRSVYVTLNVNSPADSPPVNIDDVLQFNVTINPIAGDEFPNDNSFEYHEAVVGAFDPNNITCLQGNILPTIDIGGFLHYIINFENEGNAPAENVVIEVDIDDLQYDINTLRVLNASHEVQTRLEDGKAKFIFEGISLAASGGHGNILIRIKSNDNLNEGDSVMKKANIYFDYNFPIQTNTANTTYQNLSVNEFGFDRDFLLFPNPATDQIMIKSKYQIENVRIFDLHGRKTLSQKGNAFEIAIDLSSLSDGVYFIEMTNKNRTLIEKLIKR